MVARSRLRSGSIVIHGARSSTGTGKCGLPAANAQSSVCRFSASIKVPPTISVQTAVLSAEWEMNAIRRLEGP